MCNHNLYEMCSLGNGGVSFSSGKQGVSTEGRELETGQIGSISAAVPWPGSEAPTQNEAPGIGCLLSRYRKRGAYEKDGTNA